jgi:hypothetical protein
MQRSALAVSGLLMTLTAPRGNAQRDPYKDRRPPSEEVRVAKCTDGRSSEVLYCSASAAFSPPNQPAPALQPSWPVAY